MRAIGWAGLVIAAGALVACSGSSRGNVSVTTRSAATTPAAAGGADLQNGVVLDEVRMVVRRVVLFPTEAEEDMAISKDQLDHEGSGSGPGSGSGDDDDFPRSSFGPFAVDLKGDALAGGIHPAFDGEVDKGTYAGARIVVNTLGGDAAITDPVLSGMVALHASIVIDGTVDGQAFEFVTPIRVAQAKRGPIVVGDATTNLTLDVDPRGWFTAPDGTTRLDPRLDASRGAILENIRCSIRLFEDDDRDGEPDDGDHGDRDRPEGCPAPVTPPM